MTKGIVFSLTTVLTIYATYYLVNNHQQIPDIALMFCCFYICNNLIDIINNLNS